MDCLEPTVQRAKPQILGHCSRVRGSHGILSAVMAIFCFYSTFSFFFFLKTKQQTKTLQYQENITKTNVESSIELSETKEVSKSIETMAKIVHDYRFFASPSTTLTTAVTQDYVPLPPLKRITPLYDASRERRCDNCSRDSLCAVNHCSEGGVLCGNTVISRASVKLFSLSPSASQEYAIEKYRTIK